jgi:hypothetical protein
VLSLFLVGVLVATLLPGVWLTAIAQDESPAALTLVDAHSTWKYEDSNTDLFGDATTDFRAKSFDDSAWQQAPAPLGYPAGENDNGVFGAIAAGSVLANRSNPNAYITYYLRTTFSLTDLAGIETLTALSSFDDGYVLYLNGHEVDRKFIPTGEVGHATIANGGAIEAKDEGREHTTDLSAFRQYLVRGTNVLAVDLHNRDNASSDIYFGLKLDATYDASETSAADKTPRQINVHVGADAATQANFTYTTVASVATKAVLVKKGSSSKLTFAGESSVGASSKYFHKIATSALEPDTEYDYTVGVAPNTYSGTFKTAPAKGSKDPIKFVYLADTQVANPLTDGKALGATEAEVAKMNPDFVYLAGDVTDTSTDEAQWESLFNNVGSYPRGGQDMFGNYLVAAIQGNHDNNTFNRHINAPAQSSWSGTQGNIVYSFDYGPVTFIMLNLESARTDATSRTKQLSYLENAVAEAQARGQWTAVGFHKSLYTGASHITDSDVIEARKFWAPQFAQLDVDFVLQGHDHVYSRGFITESGANANVANVQTGGTAQDPGNAPLYMCGGHAGGLKWYSKKSYAAATDDPLTNSYAFLDKNSTDDGSDIKQEQVIVELEISNTEAQINTYMFKYDIGSDQITTPKYLYDSLTVRRAAPQVLSADIAGPDSAVIERDEELTYTVNYKNLVNANAFDTEISYDPNVLEFVRAGSVDQSALVNQVTHSASTGKARVITALATPVTAAAQDVATFTFRAKKPLMVSATAVQLIRADSVQAVLNGSGQVTGSLDLSATRDTDTASTTLISYELRADVNGSGTVTLADLSFAVSRYQSTDPADAACDIDGDGVVDTADFILIASFIK